MHSSTQSKHNKKLGEKSEKGNGRRMTSRQEWERSSNQTINPSEGVTPSFQTNRQIDAPKHTLKTLQETWYDEGEEKGKKNRKEGKELMGGSDREARAAEICKPKRKTELVFRQRSQSSSLSTRKRDEVIPQWNEREASQQAISRSRSFVFPEGPTILEHILLPYLSMFFPIWILFSSLPSSCFSCQLVCFAVAVVLWEQKHHHPTVRQSSQACCVCFHCLIEQSPPVPP